MTEGKSIIDLHIKHHYHIQEVSRLFYNPEQHYSKIMVIAYNKVIRWYSRKHTTRVKIGCIFTLCLVVPIAKLSLKKMIHENRIWFGLCRDNKRWLKWKYNINVKRVLNRAKSMLNWAKSMLNGAKSMLNRAKGMLNRAKSMPNRVNARSEDWLKWK